MNLAQRKKLILLRSDLLRRSLALQLGPIRQYAEAAEHGYRLARALAKLLSSSSRR